MKRQKKKLAQWGVSVVLSLGMLQAGWADSVPDPAMGQEDKFSVPLFVTPIPLNHQNHSITTIGKLHYLGGLKITSSDERFGGISGFEISPDGRQVLGISDNNEWLVADIVYDQNDRLTDLKNARMAPIRNLPNQEKNNKALDAEAVAAVDGAGYVVAFESPHTLRYFQARRPHDYASLFTADAQEISFAPAMHETFATLPANLGVEALTTLPDGRMLAISEHTRIMGDKNLAAGWLIGHGKIEPITYELGPSFKPTDMATLPNGDILVLERHLSLAKGMATRLTRLSAMSIVAGNRITGEVIAELCFPFNLDNMEALAVRKNDAGETIIYIMSDNNFNSLQRNLLMMFRIDG